jgi:ABC-2 type transport system ATP-binding protein
MEYAVEIQNLTKDYETGFLRKKRVRALDDLSLNVEPGQIFGFLGGNGAGKTTTIKTLMRLQFPTSGTAKILGRDINDVQMHRRIGYCPENPYFYDYLTASELMDYFGQLFGQDTATRRRKCEELLTAVGLQEKDWRRQLRKYSKGMLQRVGLAQSLINDPEIVFMDEPMSGLDPVGRREIRELIAGLREKARPYSCPRTFFPILRHFATGWRYCGLGDWQLPAISTNCFQTRTAPRLLRSAFKVFRPNLFAMRSNLLPERP